MIINSDLGYGGFVPAETQESENKRRFVSIQKVANGKPKYHITLVPMGEEKMSIVIRQYHQQKVEWKLMVIYNGTIENSPAALIKIFKENGMEMRSGLK